MAPRGRAPPLLQVLAPALAASQVPLGTDAGRGLRGSRVRVTEPARLKAAAGAPSWPWFPVAQFGPECGSLLPSWDGVYTPWCGREQPEASRAAWRGPGRRVEWLLPTSTFPRSRGRRPSWPGQRPLACLLPGGFCCGSKRCCRHPAGGEAQRNLIPFLPGERSSSPPLGGSLFLA